jgi:protein TonB
MEPDAEPVVAKKESVKKVKDVEKKRAERLAAEKAKRSREAQARDRNGAPAGRGQGSDASGASGRYGVPGGRGQGSGTSRVGGRFGLPGGRGQGAAASQAACLVRVAASVRSHLPGATSLGPGTANVTFYVNSGGGISGISVSASTPAHAALARRIVASSRGPSSCAPTYASQHMTFE